MDPKGVACLSEGNPSNEGGITSLSSKRDQADYQANSRLRQMLSANDIKHFSAQWVIKLLAFGLKKMQFYSQGMSKHCKEPRFLGNQEESISEIRRTSLKREHSLIPHYQSKVSQENCSKDKCRGPAARRPWSEKAQIIDEILGKLGENSKSCNPCEEERKFFGEFGKRITHLQNFMKRIKMQRLLNVEPAVIHQKTIIPNANSHKLLTALDLSKKQSVQSRDGLILQALQQVKKELKNVKNSQERLRLSSSQSSFSHSSHKPHINFCPRVKIESDSFFNKKFPIFEIEERAKRLEESSASKKMVIWSFGKQT